jgi:hypothetical protein
MVQRRKNMTKQFRLADGNGGKAKSPGSSAWRRLVIAGGLCLGLAANFALAQVAEPRIWPTSGRSLWFWIEPKTDFLSEQVDAAFKKAVDEGMAFLDPAFSSSVFFAKHIRLTAGKARERKKYKDQPAKADDIRIETEWQTGDMNQYRGSSYCFIALNSVRSLDLHYLPNLRERFPKAPESRNWTVNILAGSLYNFFFGTEDAARNFINAVASLLKQRGINLTFSRFGLMWENVTPAQAADMGKQSGESVLVTMVAIAGPADRAGIRPLDVVLEVNGVKVKNFSHFSLLLDGMASGTKASLVLLRRLKAPDMYPEQNVWNTMTVEMEAR